MEARGTQEALPFVHAFWEAGAAAFNRIDEWSDIDLYIVVDEAAAVPETFVAVERALTALSRIRLKTDVSWPPASRFFRSSIALKAPANSFSSISP